MRRPARIRRLSIAALLSCSLFLIIAVATARSFWIWESWHLDGWSIGLDRGSAIYVSGQVNRPPYTDDSGPTSAPDIEAALFPVKWSFLGFSERPEKWPVTIRPPIKMVEIIVFKIPMWCPLLSLLIAPLWWLIARPANSPASSVITDANRT